MPERTGIFAPRPIRPLPKFERRASHRPTVSAVTVRIRMDATTTLPQFLQSVQAQVTIGCTAEGLR